MFMWVLDTCEHKISFTRRIVCEYVYSEMCVRNKLHRPAPSAETHTTTDTYPNICTQLCPKSPIAFGFCLYFSRITFNKTKHTRRASTQTRVRFVSIFCTKLTIFVEVNLFYCSVILVYWHTQKTFIAHKNRISSTHFHTQITHGHLTLTIVSTLQTLTTGRTYYIYLNK